REFYSREDYPTAAQAIGYKELLPYLKGSEELDTCVERLKQETRKYAKRQLTWFRKDERIHWIKVTDNTDSREILEIAKKYIKMYGNFC
ncbi:MAG: tRNA (adenosine(37)-N6)-dimethylallyltransferase MiaA, partial [Ruminiclostridium sp.]|nr:tRNA (adenosine(37)-N6)-dimethylallyltransferase MiaA [Ruminiclostridium sp.]